MKTRRGRYSSTPSLTSVLDWGGWLTPFPVRFIPRQETQYPWYRRLDGLHGRSGKGWKISPPTGIQSLDRLSRSESLYRLSCPGPYIHEEADQIREILANARLRGLYLPVTYPSTCFKTNFGPLLLPKPRLIFTLCT